MRFRSTVEQELDTLPPKLRKVILAACRDIFDDWTIGKLLNEGVSKHRSYRVGVYRIVYVVRKSSQVEIVAIGHRKDVYTKI